MRRSLPPAWAEWLLSRVLPYEDHDGALGDLREEFEARVARCGRPRASIWYVAEAARSLWPFLTYGKHRRRRSGNWRNAMMGFEQDLRGALRVFTKAPGFAAVVLLTIAFGVGSATAVYSVVKGVLLSPLPFRDSERVVTLWGQTPDYPRTPLTVGDHNALVEGISSFAGVAAEWGNTALILGEAEAEQVSVGWVTDNYFDVVGVRPELGRALHPEDSNAIVMAHDLWARRYGADPSVIGDVVNLSGTSFELAGILPADQNPNLTSFSGGAVSHQVWRLMPPDWTQGDDRSVAWLRTSARLRDGVTMRQAQAEVDTLFEEINQTITERDGGTDLSITLRTARQDLVHNVSRTLWILLGAVCGVLLIAATNVANLMLGRGEMRTREVSVRAALGGSRTRLVRQFLMESGVLAGAGALAGLVVAWWGIRGLVAMAPPTLPRLDAVQLDAGVLVFALAATVVTAIIFGVVPAIRVSGVDAGASLGDRHASAGRRQQRLSRGLVVAQVALSLALVSATGLLARSLSGLHGVDLGFETEGVVTFALEAPAWGDDNDSAAARLIDYTDRIEAVAGVDRAGFSNRIPLGGGLFTGSYRSAEMVAVDAPKLEASFRYVTPGFLEALGARITAGRGFRRSDTGDVIVVDEKTAGRAFAGENPLGKRLEIGLIGGDPAFAEIIGVVAPMKHAGVAEAAEETIFTPMLAAAQQNFHYMAVRVDGEPLGYLDPLGTAVRAVDPDAVIARVRTMDALFAADVADTRFATLLLSLFGLAALMLATLGLHGVMAVALRSRRREMGIRLALGAAPGAILARAAGSGATLVFLGVGAGVLLSLAIGRSLGALLYEVRPTDALTLSGASAVILGVGLLAAYLPARLVLGVDPAETLREE